MAEAVTIKKKPDLLSDAYRGLAPCTRPSVAIPLFRACVADRYVAPIAAP